MSRLNELISEHEADDLTVCSKCGGDAKFYQRGSCQGYHCNKCGWGAITTFIEPIRADNTEYTLTIERINAPSLEQIRVTAGLIGENYLEVKRRLKAGSAIIKEQAVAIKAYAKILQSENLLFFINPEFPHDIDDNPVPISKIDLEIEDLLWFALDREGSVVAFTSAGTGNVPAFVCADKITNEKLYAYFLFKCESFSEIKFDDHAEKYGLEEDAEAYCQKGIFYYDAEGEDYHRIATPTIPLKYEDLDLEIQKIMETRRLIFVASESVEIKVPHAF